MNRCLIIEQVAYNCLFAIYFVIPFVIITNTLGYFYIPPP